MIGLNNYSTKKRLKIFKEAILLHIFIAHLKYESNKDIVILADTLDEAKQKAQEFFGLSSVSVDELHETYDSQIYKMI